MKGLPEVIVVIAVLVVAAVVAVVGLHLTG